MKRILSNLNLLTSVFLAFLLSLMLNFIALRNPVRADWSHRQYYALSNKTKDILRNLDQRVNVYVLFPKEDELYLDIHNLLDEYKYQSQNIHVEWIDPARDLAHTEKLAKKYDLTDAQVIVFELGDQYKVVKKEDLADYRMVRGQKQPVLSAFKGEQAFSSALQSLIEGKTPVVYFLVGHGEKRLTDFDQISGYSRLATAIFRDNMEPRELMLTKEHGIPDDISALVIAGPEKRLESTEIEMIEDYLAQGGRVMVLIDALKHTGLDPMLRRWGVALSQDFVLDPANTLKGSDVYVRTYYEHPITLRLANTGSGVRFFLPRSVEPLKSPEESAGEDRPTVAELVITSKKSWSETQVNQTTAKYDEGTGDRRGPICLAVAVERGTPQESLDVQIAPSRLVVIGDADFASNGALTGGDQDFFMSALNWLIDRGQQIAIDPKPLEEVRLALTEKQLTRLFWLNVVGIPFVAVLLGLSIWFRRRK